MEEVFLGVHIEARQSSRRTGDEKEGNQQIEVETTENYAVEAPAMNEKGRSHATVYYICKAVHLEAKGALGFGPTSHPSIHQIASASDKNGHSGCIRIVLDEKDLYVGSFDRSFFLETVIPWSNLIDYPTDGSPSDIASWIKSKSIFGLALEYPETRIDSGEGFRFSVGQNKSVAETMEKLLTTGKDFIAVVDNYGRFQGTVCTPYQTSGPTPPNTDTETASEVKKL